MARRRLTQQQKQRIKAIQQRRREKLDERAEACLHSADEGTPLEGRIIVRHGAALGVESAEGEITQCLTRQNIGHPVCGDRVIWHRIGNRGGVVTALQPRSSVLSRPDYSGRDKPLAANLSQLVVVVAPKPPPGGFLLDQYLVTAETIGVKPLIAVNKIDLLEGEEAQRFFTGLAHYQAIDYAMARVSAKKEHGLDELVAHLKGETSILVGQSGVGKSSLINALLPDHEVETGRLSETTGHGRHTTSAATLYHLPQGGELIDSPGVRSFRLTNLTRQMLEQGFPEFRPYLGRCRFHNCSHNHEPECAIRAAVESGRISALRLESFHRLTGITK